MKKIINSLCKDEDKFNYDAVRLARENKGKINEYLLELVDDTCKQLDDGWEYVPLYFDYAVFLLAEFRDTRLFPLLIKILDREDVALSDTIGYGVMDKLPSIIVSVFDNDFESINKIIKNGNIKGYTRAMLLSSYSYFYPNKLISEDDLIKLLRELIEIYNYDDEWMYGSIMSLVADLHIFPMMDDVKKMFYNDAIDPHERGGYDSFVDDIFDYSGRYSDNVHLIDDVVKEMSWWACFKSKDEKEADVNKISEKYAEFVANDLEENVITLKKVGRNEPCPCGSGKKYKKCCLEKEQSLLPYQGYIDKSLEGYPKENKNKNEVNFYTYYKEEYINVDKLLYKALKNKQVPLFVKRNKNKENDIDFSYLDEAYNLIKGIIKKNKFKTIDEYDNVVSIHYSLYDFFQKYSKLFINNIKSLRDNKRDLYVSKLKELLEFFYDSFDLNNENEDLFLNRYHILFNETNNWAEGIKFFEDKLLNCKCDKYYVYEILFEEYFDYYDFDEVEKKMDTLITKEKDLELKEELITLKIEMLELY